MNQKEFKKLFQETTELEGIEVLSTFDHIFSSFPLRIIDSHNKYSSIKNTKYLVWDINSPVEKRFKTELAIDGVFLNTNNQDFFLYETNRIYAKTKILLPDIQKIKTDSEYVSNIIFGKRVKTKATLSTRLDEILDIYSTSLKSNFETPFNFYSNLLNNYYIYLGLNSHSDIIKTNFVSLYNSNITKKYIPELIRTTMDSPFGILGIISNGSQIFEPPYFRKAVISDKLDIDLSDLSKSNMVDICNELEKGNVIPAQEIVSWSFALAGLGHIGNDYGIYQKLYESFPDELSYIKDLQLSKPKEDGANFIQFTSEVFQYKNLGSKYTKVIGNPKRSMNIVSALIHMGMDNFIDSYTNFQNNGTITDLEYGNILTD